MINSLLVSIRDLLVNANHPNPDFFLQHEYIKAVIGTEDCRMSRVYINRFWRQYLGSLPTDTTVARLILEDTGSDKNYLHNFKDYVLPTIMQYSKL
jgi:hypothetical protein